MELNGIANILASIWMAKEDGKISSEVYEEITNECDLLERYMLAVSKASRDKVKPPFWHEVRKNPHKYPTRKQS